MPEMINGLPYWELGFDKDGRLAAPAGGHRRPASKML